MARLEKLIKRLLSCPKDFTFDELRSIMVNFGFCLSNAGKTSGSAVRFVNLKTGKIIRLHKPHPSPIVKQYALKFIIDELTKWGYLNDK